MTFPGKGNGRHQARVRTTLGSALDDPVVPLRRPHQLPPLPDVVGYGLLQVDIFARLACPDAHQRMPVVRRGDGHRIDLVVVQELPEIGVGLHRLLALFEALHLTGQDHAVHIAQRRHAHAFQPAEPIDVGAPPAVQANHTDADVFVGAAHAARHGSQGKGHDSGP